MFSQFIKGVVKYNPYDSKDFYSKFKSIIENINNNNFNDIDTIVKHNTKKWVESIMIDLKHVY